MKNIFFLFFAIVTVIYSQPHLTNPIKIEINQIPIDSSAEVYFSYKIPLNVLVFIKDDNLFRSEFDILWEITEIKSKSIKREFTSEKLGVTNFEITNSPNDFVQGVTKAVLPSGSYSVMPIFSFGNTGDEIRLKPINLKVLNYDENKFYRPLIIHSEKSNCGDNDSFLLSNSESSIAFSPEKYSMLIPSGNINEDSIKIVFKKDKEIAAEFYSSEKIKGKLSLNDCEQAGVQLLFDDSSNATNYLLRDFNNTLDEGNYLIEISNPGREIIDTFRITVNWFDKPVALFNLEYAIKYLELIFDPEQINKLLDTPDEKLGEEFNKLWKSLDPTENTSYNELISEFYRRVDYASKNYSSIAKPDGAASDRGKIFIKLGKPDEVNRYYTDRDNISEVWIYKKLNKEFLFSDTTGMGNYILQN